jgi:hypothetical protein
VLLGYIYSIGTPRGLVVAKIISSASSCEPSGSELGVAENNIIGLAPGLTARGNEKDGDESPAWRASGANVVVDLTDASGGVERGSWCGRPDRRHPMMAFSRLATAAQPEATPKRAFPVVEWRAWMGLVARALLNATGGDGGPR